MIQGPHLVGTLLLANDPGAFPGRLVSFDLMKAISRFTLVTFAVALLAITSLASTKVTGKWKGHILMDNSHMPKNLSPDQMKMYSSVKSIVISITFNKDNTFTETASGGPIKTPKSDGGTWKQVGNTIVVVPNNAYKSGRKSETLTISKDGKKLTGQAGPGGTVLFTR